MIRSIKIAFVAILTFVVFFNQALAGDSIYSLRGQGVFFYYPGGRATAMGGATIAVASPNNLNWLNPAALSVQNHVRISTQFLFQNLDIKNGSQQYHTNYANFNGFIAALPIINSKIGVGFGIQPLTKINFEFENSEEIDNIQYRTVAKGLGGLNRLFLATGFRVLPQVMMGVGFGLVFGKSDETWRVIFDNTNYTNAYDQFRSKYWGVNANMGAIIAPSKGWTIGAVYQTAYDLNKNVDVSYFEPELTQSSEVKLKLPAQWGIGTSLSLKEKFLLAADYLYQNWENYRAANSSESFTQMQRLSCGFEYGLPVQTGMSFLEKLRYRLGFAWQQPYYLDYNNKKLSSYFVSAGVGVPFASGAGALDFTLEYGKRGSVPTNTFEESIWRFSVYVSGGELWFQR